MAAYIFNTLFAFGLWCLVTVPSVTVISRSVARETDTSDNWIVSALLLLNSMLMNRTISSDSKQLQSGKLTTNAVHWEPVLAVMSNRGRCSHPKCKRNRVLCAGCCFSFPSGSRSWAELRAVQVQHQQRESDAHLRLLKVVFAYLAHVESPCFVNAEVKQTSYFHCLQHQTCSPPLLFLPLQAFFFSAVSSPPCSDCCQS